MLLMSVKSVWTQDPLWIYERSIVVPVCYKYSHSSSSYHIHKQYITSSFTEHFQWRVLFINNILIELTLPRCSTEEPGNTRSFWE